MVSVRMGGLALGVVLLGAGHPTHSSVAELRQERPRGPVEIMVRLFPDDLQAAVPGAGATAADSALASYVRKHFALADPAGRPVALRYAGSHRSADVLVLRLQTMAAVELSGSTVSHSLLSERFSDQVNVVRAAYAGRTATLIFVPGDPAKRLP